MDYQAYLAQVKSNLASTQLTTLENCGTTVAYEEVFRWKWIATKLKIFSFITHAQTIDMEALKKYTTFCVRYARNNKKGLPLGFQNGVVCNNILVSEAVTEEAISFVTARPNKHYSLFEMPIIYDLSKNKLYYYEGDIIWGMMYSRFINQYITNHFNVKG